MKCTNCGYEFETGDTVYLDGVSERICEDCLRDMVDDLPNVELAKLLGYDWDMFDGDDEEEEKKPETVKQIPGQMDIWGGAPSE